jgi:hypothetical protein
MTWTMRNSKRKKNSPLGSRVEKNGKEESKKRAM